MIPFLFYVFLILNMLMGFVNLYIFAKYQKFVSFLAMMLSFGVATSMALSLYA